MEVYIANMRYDLNSSIDRGILIRAGLDPEQLKKQKEAQSKYYRNKKINEKYKFNENQY